MVIMTVLDDVDEMSGAVAYGPAEALGSRESRESPELMWWTAPAPGNEVP
jgi:hypothetical protein